MPHALQFQVTLRSETGEVVTVAHSDVGGGLLDTALAVVHAEAARRGGAWSLVDAQLAEVSYDDALVRPPSDETVTITAALA